MRIIRVVLALAFGLAMAGPEAHECPVHDAHTAPSAPASHHDASAPGHQGDAGQPHQSDGLCTCPQACCPVGVGVALPTASASWSIPSARTHASIVATADIILPGAPRHLLPFALPPPPALA